jgi:hypothetical protein
MFLIEQARIRRDRGVAAILGAPTHDVLYRRRNLERFSRPYPVADCGHTACVESNRCDHEVAVFQFIIDSLADWQVEAASSP